jgi:hypothetical protein
MQKLNGFFICQIRFFRKKRPDSFVEKNITATFAVANSEK